MDSIQEMVARSRALHEACLGKGELPPAVDRQTSDVHRDAIAQNIAIRSRHLSELYLGPSAA